MPFFFTLTLALNTVLPRTSRSNTRLPPAAALVEFDPGATTGLLTLPDNVSFPPFTIWPTVSLIAAILIGAGLPSASKETPGRTTHQRKRDSQNSHPDLREDAGAVLLEVGGVLQHGAVVAREYGKPCVVGVDRLLTRLSDGQQVEVDGTAGVIRLLTDPRGAVSSPRD